MVEDRQTITGLGVDIVEIARMRDALTRRPRMKERLFSEAEREYCEGRNKPEIHYAMRFAAKEAVLKALGCGLFDIPLTDIEVLREAGGRPFVNLHGQAASTAKQLGVSRIHITITHTGQTAAAQAVAEKD